MNLSLDLRVVELLASRLCHDLVSPISAVNNGIELLEEDPDPDLLGDAVRLARNSAQQASAVVQFYRLAYGRGGRRLDAHPSELRDLVTDYLAPHKTRLDWQVETLGEEAPIGSGKLLLNMVALGVEMLPRGGTITVAARAASGLDLQVAARGPRARLAAETQEALDPTADPDALTPRTVQAYFTVTLARAVGGALAVRPGEDEVVLHAAGGEG